MLSEISVSLPGTETDFFARYRAFPRLESHYRTYLFRECRACGLLEAADISNASEVKMCITKGDLMSKRESPSYPKWSIFHHDAVNQYKITLPFLMWSQPPIMYADLLCMNFFRSFSERSIVLFHFYTIYGFSKA